jgi:hypothetical protein
MSWSSRVRGRLRKVSKTPPDISLDVRFNSRYLRVFNIIDVHLLEDLQSLVRLQYQHHDLCSFAAQFRSLSALNDLCRKHSTSTGRSEWSKIRHCIGRLGSWSRASKIAVRVAKRNPHVVNNFQVYPVPPCPPVIAPAADHKTTLQGLLHRMLPKHENELLRRVWEALRGSRFVDFVAGFQENYANKKVGLHLHSEVLLLEHFYMNRFKFFGDERYIGCSKRSCYCCDHYIKLHPGEFVPRRSHGNLWIKWSLPSLVVDDDGKINWHAKRTLARMAQQVQNDALARIMSKLPCRPRMPDSSTGLSTIPAMSTLGLDIVRVEYFVYFPAILIINSAKLEARRSGRFRRERRIRRFRRRRNQ